MAEGAAFSVVGKFVEDLVTLTGRQLRYMFCFNNNIKRMKYQVDQLEAKRNAVQLLVDATINNCEVVGPDVDLWLKRVEERKKEADLVLIDVNAIETTCLNSLNLKSRYWLSRKSTKRTQNLVDLLTQGDFEMVAYPRQILGKVVEGKEDEKLGTTSMSSFGELNSRLAILDSVMEAVRDPNIYTIGICGMGGVGKTTLVKQVEKIVRNEDLFDEIAIAVVSQNPDVKGIQTGIADFLGLKFNEDSLLARASRLHERLYQIGPNGKPKRILVILDDVWKKLDLEELGIRFPNDPNGCKIVLTSRSTIVCQQMKAVLFHIDILPEEEAWLLFRNSLGSSEPYPTAKPIVGECKGLPIAITTIAMHLGDAAENTWNYVLQQLKTSSLEGEYKIVYTVFHVSYANLDTQERKDVFLLCCLFPKDSNILIEDIVTYGMGLKVFKKIKKIHEARVRTHVHVEALKKLNLLLESDELESVKMHDLVRDFGISIASEGKFLVQFDSEVKEWLMEDSYERCTHISIQCNGMNEFPNGLKYSNLKFLQLSGETSTMFGFPERIDEVIGEIPVLVLRDIFVPRSLLVSFERLRNLTTLSLSFCDISKDISSIGNLEKLEILSFANSNISELPGEIGKLCWLRVLDLSQCVYLRKIAPGLVKCLSRLEELKMAGTSILRDEKITNDDNSDEGDEIKIIDDDNHYACFAELKHLQELVFIEIEIPDGYLLLDLNLANLINFRIAIDSAMPYYSQPEEAHQNCLVLKGRKFFPLKGLLEALLKKTEFLLVEVKDLKSLTNEVAKEDLISLRTLIFQNCDELVYVFAGINQGLNSRDSSFRNLTTLELSTCEKLQSVCSASTARNFTNLKKLIISECSSIHVIFSTESAGSSHQDEKDLVELRSLKKIRLSSLPNLVSFCKFVDAKFNLPQLKKVDLEFLPKLTSLYPEMSSLSDSSFPNGSSSKNPFFHQKDTLNNMVELDIFFMENLIELWPQLEPGPSNFGPRRLKLDQCNNLLRVFSSNKIVQQFECLESLILYNCDSVEVIYDFRGMINIDGDKIVALSTQLSHLHLSCLPKLTHVVRTGRHINYQGFQDLKELYIDSCHSLKSMFSLSIARGMPMLEIVKVLHCDTMEAIFFEEEEETIKTGDDASTIVFPNLIILELQGLPSLVGFCKSNFEVVFPRLKDIYFTDLPNLVGLNSGMETNVSGQTFEQKIKLNWSSLESLSVERCGYLDGAKTWTRILGESENVQQQVQCLTNLSSLSIREAENLMTIFPENVNLGLQRIKEIRLVKLPKLESVWQENAPREIQYFQNLEALFVSECTCLRTLFTPYVAENLTRLTTLRVDGCDSMVEIVAEQEGDVVISNEKQMLFPKLGWLALHSLPNLLIVLPERYSFNWSFMKCSYVDEELIHLLKRPERA